MEELKNQLVSASYETSTLGVTKGYGFTTKDGKQRYTFNETYYVNPDNGIVFRKHTTDQGEFYYKVELLDVVVETFVTKDGNNGSKTYPLTEAPYLAENAESADATVLENYLKFKMHR